MKILAQLTDEMNLIYRMYQKLFFFNNYNFKIIFEKNIHISALPFNLN